mgnify:CR=1 FL=1
MTSNVALKRIIAYLIDYLIITLISSALTYITFINPRYDEYIETSQAYNEILQDYYDREIDANELTERTQELSYELNSNGYVYTIGSIVITFLYFSVFVYFTKGQTLGKKIMGIRIVSNKGKELKMHNYLIRTFILNGVIMNLLTLIAICFKESTYLTIYTVASNFDMILMIIIFLMILFYKDGRGLHDILAGTKVIDVRDEANLAVEEEHKEEKEEVEVIKPKKTTKGSKKNSED